MDMAISFTWTTFSHPSKLFDDLANNKTVAETVRPNRKGIPGSIDHKMLKLNRKNIRARTRCVLTAMV
jgi:hypothetical protein